VCFLSIYYFCQLKFSNLNSSKNTSIFNFNIFYGRKINIISTKRVKCKKIRVIYKNIGKNLTSKNQKQIEEQEFLHKTSFK